MRVSYFEEVIREDLRKLFLFLVKIKIIKVYSRYIED